MKLYHTITKGAAALLTAVMVMTSCTDPVKFGDDFIEKQPGGTVTLDTVFSNAEYTRRVDAGEKDDFATDGIAYGLVQWCYRTRKQGLLDLALEQGKSVGDINLQLDYLWQEFQKYKTVLNAVYNATNVREASDIVMLKYEKPANTNEYMKVRRANYGEKYLKKYGQPTIDISVKLETAANLLDELAKVID